MSKKTTTHSLFGMIVCYGIWAFGIAGLGFLLFSASIAGIDGTRIAMLLMIFIFWVGIGVNLHRTFWQVHKEHDS